MVRILKNINRVLALTLVLVFSIGCDTEPAKETVHLQGKVTIAKGAIPADATARIVFSPTGVSQANPVQADIKDGSYDCPDVPKGKILVTFDILQPGPVVSFDGRARPEAQMKSLVPDSKVQGVEIEVNADKADQNFDL